MIQYIINTNNTLLTHMKLFFVLAMLVAIDANLTTSSNSFPGYFDWRNVSPPVVTDVYDQGMCGSCWAFSATENVESQWALQGNSLTSLSVQEVVSCDRAAYGCAGGWPSSAYDFMETNGLEPASDYKYIGFQPFGMCTYNASDVIVNITGWANVTTNKNETEMMEKLLSMGPLSVCVDASTWQNYKGGVITKCGTSIDHCVLITGFDTVVWNGISYDIWIVRNSWGTNWGINGYVWIQRNVNMCAIAEVVTTAIV